jgi:iron complex outermembrane receptor protein
VLVPHPNLFTGFGVGYNPTVYDDFPGSPCTVEQDWQVNQDTPLLRQDCTQDLTGRPLDNAPEWSVSLFSQYEQGVGSVPRIGSLVGFVRADWSYQSRIYLQQDLDPHLQQPAYGLLNLRLGLKTEDEGWEVAFGVRNVTDTDYNVFGADVPIVNGFAVINGPPRQFMGTIRFRF